MNSDNSAEEYRPGYRDARLAVNPECLNEKEVRGFHAQTECRGGGTNWRAISVTTAAISKGKMNFCDADNLESAHFIFGVWLRPKECNRAEIVVASLKPSEMPTLAAYTFSVQLPHASTTCTFVARTSHCTTIGRPSKHLCILLYSAFSHCVIGDSVSAHEQRTVDGITGMRL